MTTNYSQTDRLPSDSGGQKFAAWIDDSTSQLDFALPRGLGVETLGATSKIVGAQQIGTHTAGSAVGTQVGVMLIGAYTEAPSAIGTGNAQLLRSDKEGALYVRGASSIASLVTTSANLMVNGSALLESCHVVFNDCNAGDTITIGDGTALRYQFVATAASQHFFQNFSGGIYFGTDIRQTRSIGAQGNTSVTIGYSQF
jgi:hypothetical protein